MRYRIEMTMDPNGTELWNHGHYFYRKRGPDTIGIDGADKYFCRFIKGFKNRGLPGYKKIYGPHFINSFGKETYFPMSDKAK